MSDQDPRWRTPPLPVSLEVSWVDIYTVSYQSSVKAIKKSDKKLQRKWTSIKYTRFGKCTLKFFSNKICKDHRDAGSRKVLYLPFCEKVAGGWQRRSAEENTFYKRKCTLKRKAWHWWSGYPDHWRPGVVHFTQRSWVRRYARTCPDTGPNCGERKI